jgi:hypothetical protein
VPALQVSILYIVVDQREVVDQLQSHRGGKPGNPFAAQRLAGEETQRRSQCLSPGYRSQRQLTPLINPPHMILEHVPKGWRAVLCHEVADGRLLLGQLAG